MHIFFENLIDEDKCKILSEIVVNMMSKKSLHFEGTNDHYANSYGVARIPEYEKLLSELTPMIARKCHQYKIKEENSYSRIYYNGAKLKKHVDREGLDLTLSICIFSNINKPWPLHVECQDGVVRSFETKPGDGALILGTKMNHWRDPLVCEENQMVIQSFYHWRILDVNKIF